MGKLTTIAKCSIVGTDPAFPMALYLRCLLNLQNYVKTEVSSNNGEPLEAMQFKAPPELSQFTDLLDVDIKEWNQRVESDNIEFNASSAIENSSKGTPELAAKAVGLAKLKTDENEETLAFIAAAAVLVLRDGDAELKAENSEWAVKKLSDIGTQGSDYHYGGFSVLRYNRAAIALIGLTCVLTTPMSEAQLRPILTTVATNPRAISPGLHKSLEKSAEITPVILKSIIRIALSACIYPSRHQTDEVEQELRLARSTARLNRAINAEIDWHLHSETEPNWPKLPPAQPDIRHTIRVGKAPIPDVDAGQTEIIEVISPKSDNLFFDCSSAASILAATTQATRFNWLLEFLDYSWPFTKAMNGLEEREKRITPPREWNDCYYAFLAEALSTLEKRQACLLLDERLISLPNDSFISSVSPFLQHLDDMTFGSKTIPVQEAVDYREIVADRMMTTPDWRGLIGDRSSSMAMDFRPAISSLFFNSSEAFGPSKARLLEPGIDRLDPAIPLLVKCISSTPSYAIAVFTMNLVEVVFRESHRPMILALATSCLANNIVEREFWNKANMGARVCAYFDKLRRTDMGQEDLELLIQDLDNILNQLILIGIPEAQRLHDALIQGD